MELERNGAEDELGALREIFKKEGLYISTDRRLPEEIFEEISQYLQV